MANQISNNTQNNFLDAEKEGVLEDSAAEEDIVY